MYETNASSYPPCVHKLRGHSRGGARAPELPTNGCRKGTQRGHAVERGRSWDLGETMKGRPGAQAEGGTAVARSGKLAVMEWMWDQVAAAPREEEYLHDLWKRNDNRRRRH